MAVLEPTNATEKRPTRHSKSSARSAAWLLRGFKRQKHYYHYFTTCELRTPRPGLLSPAALKRKHIVNSWPLLRPSSPSLRKALPRVACARDTSAGCGSPVVNASGRDSNVLASHHAPTLAAPYEPARSVPADLCSGPTRSHVAADMHGLQLLELLLHPRHGTLHHHFCSNLFESNSQTPTHSALQQALQPAPSFEDLHG